mmetsp:Transcript_14929/g.23384  ORF Transcript_14929/g.23384 Transcript_14929/m.23384 type:complete len:96 (-) Transcript_14929:16-303(-)
MLASFSSRRKGTIHSELVGAGSRSANTEHNRDSALEKPRLWWASKAPDGPTQATKTKGEEGTRSYNETKNTAERVSPRRVPLWVGANFVQRTTNK